ncbi:EAL domain-containing protein [Arcobacter sp. LA11]|uniref:bifunctional diguanylate cyclase/phosphodiesterase n=1 Tax=Arcobacter sp. LA11 TaxID=1898176 RepID=UPI0009326E8A|nr:EAL domain-containing protein [Arcobacter sp. LA11]
MKTPFFSLKLKVTVFLINLLILLIIGVVQYIYQVSNLKNKFNYNIENIIEKELSNRVSTTKGVITSLSSYYQYTSNMNTSSFSSFSNDLLKNYDFMEVIAFATVVQEKERVSFEEEMKDNGLYNFYIKDYDKNQKLIKINKLKDRYAPIIYIEPASYKYTRFYGFDIYNNNIFNEAFILSSKSGKVIVKDRVIDELGNKLNLFIKATYKGEDRIENESLRYANTNGFYIININIDKLLEKVKKKFNKYHIEIVDINEYGKYLEANSSKKENIFKKLIYLKKIEGFEHSFLLITKQLTLKDFNLFVFISVLLVVILIQVLYILIWHKDKISKHKLSYKATHDDLTGLYNRNYFKKIFDNKINNKNSMDKLIALLFIDIDRFKEINDSFGHKFGDEVLIEISNRFKKIMRRNDLISRHGGDEFLILVDDIENIEHIINVIKKIMSSMNTPISFNHQNIHLRISIGISIYPNDGKTVDDLLKNADSAMYRAKEEGRNTFKFYTEDMTLKVMKKIVLENKLREAIKNDEFVVYYQPQYDGKINKLIGMEALVRWKNTEGELIPPNAFIPIAEEAGLIVDLDRLVMKKAIKQFSIWKNQGLDTGTLSLNLSMKQLKSDDFIELLNKTIIDNNCKHNSIELEVTEGGIMENPSESIEKLREISSLGIKLSVDDFGTGYSSLAYLKKLPINKLKIDRAFVKDLPFDEEDTAITKSVIVLSKSLKLDVIAEGVENQEQIDFLVKNGCYKIQGYFYGKPMNYKEFEKLLNRNV